MLMNDCTSQPVWGTNTPLTADHLPTFSTMFVALGCSCYLCPQGQNDPYHDKWQGTSIEATRVSMEWGFRVYGLERSVLGPCQDMVPRPLTRTHPLAHPNPDLVILDTGNASLALVEVSESASHKCR